MAKKYRSKWLNLDLKQRRVIRQMAGEVPKVVPSNIRIEQIEGMSPPAIEGKRGHMVSDSLGRELSMQEYAKEFFGENVEISEPVTFDDWRYVESTLRLTVGRRHLCERDQEGIQG